MWQLRVQQSLLGPLPPSIGIFAGVPSEGM
jgi:hypothetical protein